MSFGNVPTGAPRENPRRAGGALHATWEIVQTPGRILQFFEYRHDWREIWMDGRALPAPADVEPKWNGYSVGRVEGDTLVVEAVG